MQVPREPLKYGDSRMKRSALLSLLWVAAWQLAAWPLAAGAQQAAPLNEKQTLGRNLFAQSCIVCHVKTQLAAGGHFGPTLSGLSLRGPGGLVREFIIAGTPNMPGFTYPFQPQHIDAI